MTKITIQKAAYTDNTVATSKVKTSPTWHNGLVKNTGNVWKLSTITVYIQNL